MESAPGWQGLQYRTYFPGRGECRQKPAGQAQIYLVKRCTLTGINTVIIFVTIREPFVDRRIVVKVLRGPFFGDLQSGLWLNATRLGKTTANTGKSRDNVNVLIIDRCLARQLLKYYREGI